MPSSSGAASKNKFLQKMQTNTNQIDLKGIPPQQPSPSVGNFSNKMERSIIKGENQSFAGTASRKAPVLRSEENKFAHESQIHNLNKENARLLNLIQTNARENSVAKNNLLEQIEKLKQENLNLKRERVSEIQKSKINSGNNVSSIQEHELYVAELAAIQD